jgi:hypothetical protein
MRTIQLLAALSLLSCLTVPFLFFWGYLSDGTFRTLFALSSLSWFVFAASAMRRRTAR